MAGQQAGWYPDPSGDASKLRYWDGAQWTSDFNDVSAQSAFAPPGQPPGQPMNPQYVVAETPNYNNPGAQTPVYPTYIQPQVTQATNVLAIVSFACALGGFFIPVVPSIAAIIVGALALKNPGQKGLAIAGLTLGALCVLFWIVIAVMFIDFITSPTTWY